MRARSTSRTATCSRSTASPATTGGKTDRASPTASTGRSSGRTCRSDAPSGKAIASRRPGIFPEGTGLTDRFSDIVGRTRIRYGRFIDVTHRYRLDKDNLAVRRNELDLTVGTDQTYAQVGYLRLNRNIDPTIEDLRDKEELRLAGRVKFLALLVGLRSDRARPHRQARGPAVAADGFEPVRHRLGIEYEDECLELGVSWRATMSASGTFRKGSTFALHLALKGLGPLSCVQRAGINGNRHIGLGNRENCGWQQLFE
jgi:hypothetical protein